MWVPPLGGHRPADRVHANLYSDKPIATFYIDTGYQLVDLVVIGALVGVTLSTRIPDRRGSPVDRVLLERLVGTAPGNTGNA